MIRGAWEELEIWRTTGTTVNAYGELTSTGIKYATTYGQVGPLKAEERFLAAQVEADVTHRVKLHYDEETSVVRPDYWVIRGGTRLDIRAIFDEDGRKQFLTLECAQRI